MDGSSAPHLAIFDLDLTLVSMDCEAYWSEFLVKNKVVKPSFLERILGYHVEYAEGRLDIFEYQAFFNQPLLSHPWEEMLALRHAYLQDVRSSIRKTVMERVMWHKAGGATVLMLSATNSFLAMPIGEMLGFGHILCTDLKWEDGRVTNQIEGMPAFREGKVARLEQWLAQSGMAFAASWGYSDSRNDLPMLEWVDHPVAVSPDPILREHAFRYAWPILEG